MLYAWKEQADKLSSEEISKDKYDEWRYHYPEFDITQIWAKVPSQALSYEFLPAAKGFLNNMDLFVAQPPVNHSLTPKPLAYKNNSSHATVIKLLSKDFLKCLKPA